LGQRMRRSQPAQKRIMGVCVQMGEGGGHEGDCSAGWDSLSL
jgi:hypothetical protein